MSVLHAKDMSGHEGKIRESGVIGSVVIIKMIMTKNNQYHDSLSKKLGSDVTKIRQH